MYVIPEISMVIGFDIFLLSLELNKKTKVKEEDMNKRMENVKGITLIALVITVIVLLILAGVVIAALSGDNGILNRAVQAQEKTILSEKKEEVSVALQEELIENNR